MTTRTTSLALLVGMALLFSCKKSADTVSPDNCGATQTLSNKATAAATAFSNDPTNKVKCTAFVDAYKALLDAAATCTAYTQAQRDQINQSYIGAKDACD